MGLIAETKQAMRDSPREIFNVYILLCSWSFALCGVAKGFDEGNIASLVVQDKFKHTFGLSSLNTTDYANTKGWIVAIATAGAVFGCLGCTYFNDKFGRKKTLWGATLIYIAGILGQTLCNGNLSGLYASRFIAGIGIGVTTIVPPMYISEIAPKAIRGLLTIQYACCQQLGVVLGFFINYGVTKHYAGTNIQWRLPTALQLVPAVLWVAGTIFAPESPRWLLSRDRRSEASVTLSKLRKLPEDHPIVVAELSGMDLQLLHEMESVAGATQWDLLQETFIPVENRRRFFLIFMATLFSQWSGANAITQYSPTIFGYLGITGTETTFLATGIYGVVKFLSCVAFSLFIVDFVGRRRSLMTGIVLQLVTLTYVGGYLGATKNMTAAYISSQANVSRASTGAIVAIYIHAVGWSIGWFSIPYLVGAEVFPTRIRSLNMSISMAFHWAFYFGCSRAMPSLLVATHKWGAFVFFASFCFISLIYVFFAMPDTTGRSLESLDSLFQRPWYTVYKVAYPTKEEIKIEGRDMTKSEIQAIYNAKAEHVSEAQHVEGEVAQKV